MFPFPAISPGATAPHSHTGTNHASPNDGENQQASPLNGASPPADTAPLSQHLKRFLQHSISREAGDASGLTQEPFSLTHYLNNLYTYINLVHRFRHSEHDSPQDDDEEEEYDEANKAPLNHNSKRRPGRRKTQQHHTNSLPPKSAQHWIPLFKPFLFYHKFQLAKSLYLRDLHDSIHAIDMKQRILERQIQNLYRRLANFVPYRQTPKYAPLYWVFGLSHMSSSASQYASNPSAQPANPPHDSFYPFSFLIERVPMSDSLRQMLSAKPGLDQGTYGQSWGVYSVQVTEPSLLSSQNSQQQQQWTVYPELDQLMERNFMLKSALHSLRETWSHHYYHLHRGADFKTRNKIFENWCFELLNERATRVQRLIRKMRTQEMKLLRRDKSLYVSQFNQLKQINLQHPKNVSDFD